MNHHVAALYVQANGAYYGLPGVDPWDEIRDARKYDGPRPVVAHPPCQRWGKMWFGSPLMVKRTGVRKKKGDDGGCFAAALAAVRKFGGVLEHPWGSHAWPHFGLSRPPRTGGWIAADKFGGWTCCVEQGKYGHYARKPTMLYAFGVDLPELHWGHSEAQYDPAVVERLGIKRAKRLGEVSARGGGTDSTARIHTPAPFRELLLSIASSTSKNNSNFVIDSSPPKSDTKASPQQRTPTLTTKDTMFEQLLTTLAALVAAIEANTAARSTEVARSTEAAPTKAPTKKRAAKEAPAPAPVADDLEDEPEPVKVKAEPKITHEDIREVVKNTRDQLRTSVSAEAAALHKVKTAEVLKKFKAESITKIDNKDLEEAFNLISAIDCTTAADDDEDEDDL